MGAGGKATVAKVQVALTGNARSLQRELERIAKRADTNNSEGLHYVLVCNAPPPSPPPPYPRAPARRARSAVGLTVQAFSQACPPVFTSALRFISASISCALRGLYMRYVVRSLLRRYHIAMADSVCIMIWQQETVLALLRHPEYCEYGASAIKGVRGLDAAEEKFNEVLSLSLSILHTFMLTSFLWPTPIASQHG